MEYNMNINKAFWTTDGDNVRLSMPFGKVDVEKRIVSGFASLDNLDKQYDIVTTEASMKAFAKFRGNIREMHQPSAVGKMISFKEEKYFDPETKKFYKGVYVSTYISKGAQNAWEKVLDGTYTGFSIGGRMNKWDDAYNEELDKSIRIIKDYDLVELSLVDSPANQFASIMSVEKVDGVDVIKGDLANVVVENVFYDEETGIVLTSDEETYVSPVSGNEMKNIGFVEKNDSDKANMIKFLVDSAKGINTSKITKEVNPMSEDTTAVVDATVAETEAVSAEVTPEAQPAEATELVEAAEARAEATAEAQAEKSDSVADDSATSSTEDAIQTPEAPAAEDVAKADEAITNAIAEIKESVTNAFGDLTATIKSLSDEVANMKKSLDATTTDVNQIKGTFNEIGKRVDSVEKDTAFRKSGDLGEIVQEVAEVPTQKSLWGGRFLKFSDLYN
jgi:archaellum component FlaC